VFVQFGVYVTLTDAATPDRYFCSFISVDVTAVHYFIY